tara:strand:- start:364 stop:543 length:180 start_codon:yes stop_codon:yes gene_type:complete
MNNLPEYNKSLHGYSCYGDMTTEEQDKVYAILERIAADKDWNINDIYWDVIIQEIPEEL